jgi:hypothetical protein
MRGTAAATAIAVALLAGAAASAQAVPSFSKLAGEMTEKRYYPVAALLPSGNVLVAGGYNSSAKYLESAEQFSPAGGGFSALSGKPTVQRDEAGSAVLPDGSVLIVGGAGESGGKFHLLQSAEVFDPGSMTFKPVAHEMAVERRGPAVALLPTGKVLVAGGESPPSSHPRSAELYDPAGQSFKAIGGEMTVGRYGSATATLPNGKVLIAGGYNGEDLGSAELFDPATNKFEALTGPGQEMTEARDEPGHVALADGNVLIVGGFNAGKFLKTVELFNWETQTFEKLPTELAEARAGAATVLLPDGRILVAGGYNEASLDLRTAELSSVTPPTVVTTPASNVETHAAALNGTVAAETATTSYFQYGPTTAYGATTPAQAVAASNQPVAFTSTITGLLPGDTYHYRAVSENAAGPSYGADQTVTTASLFPIVNVKLNIPSGAAPVISNVTQSHSRWRRSKKLAVVSRRKPPVGTVFSFRLNAQANVSYAFTQTLSGREVNHRCVAQTKSNRHGKACRANVARGTLVFPGHAGVNHLAFAGQLSRSRRLLPGSYTVAVTATNDAKQASATKRLSFTIVK